MSTASAALPQTKPKTRRFFKGRRNHRGIQNFGRNFVILAVIGAVLIVTGVGQVIAAKFEDLSARAMYNTSFVTTKTKARGQVVGVYTSRDKTKSLLMMKFEDMSLMSIDASRYQAYLTGSDVDMNRQDLAGHPSGSIGIFGNTGYMYFYMTDKSKFESQINALTMRANTEITTPDASSGAVSDENLRKANPKYDQWRVFYNPGASEAKPLDALNEDTPDLSKIYNEVVVKPEEATIRATLDEDLATMRTDLAAIDEYTRRLSQSKVGGLWVLPPKNLSPMITGDKVVGTPAGGGKDSTLSFLPKKSVNGGFNFDWRSGSVEKGYLSKITPKNDTALNYMSKQLAAGPDNVKFPTAEDWVLSDGRLLSNADPTLMSSPIQTTTLLTDAYTKYYQDKVKYQREDLPSLLKLELGLRDVDANKSVNTAKNALTTY